MSNQPEFDLYAERYNEALNQGLSLTGEGPEYFAHQRIKVTREALSFRAAEMKRVLDYGCGIGTAIPLLNEAFDPETIIGSDVSPALLRDAESGVTLSNARFALVADLNLVEEIDLAYCNGVFHHIEFSRRNDALGFIFRALRPGGTFAFWENNPLNPGTLAVMAKCPFDRSAQPISPPRAVRLLKSAGFIVRQVRTQFFFPRWLAAFRGLEPCLSWTMLGGQYLVLAVKPVAD